MQKVPINTALFQCFYYSTPMIDTVSICSDISCFSIGYITTYRRKDTFLLSGFQTFLCGFFSCGCQLQEVQNSQCHNSNTCHDTDHVTGCCFIYCKTDFRNIAAPPCDIGVVGSGSICKTSQERSHNGCRVA